MIDYKTIYIAGINRSGGSLLARLLDNHSKILSYPTELGFPNDNSFYEIIDSYAGIPQSIPKYKNKSENIYKLLNIPAAKPTYSTAWGKETSDPLGVRENYLEKDFYGTIKTNFDYSIFKDCFDTFSSKATNIKELYDARHHAYFSAWDNGRYLENQTHVVMQDSGGIYLTNIEDYYEQFIDSKIIYPIRDVIGYVATEKVRYARRYYGSRRFAWPQLPNYFVKRYDHYDLDAQVKGWMCALTRVRLLQEKYGYNDKFIVYNHSALTGKPKTTMMSIIKKIGLDYETTLTNPTIAGNNWLGNSHYGPTKGISNEIKKNYQKVLRNEEFDRINALTREFSDLIDDDTPVNLLDIPDKVFYDYSFQKRYFDDKDKITLYYALTNSTKRRYNISKIPAYSLFAIIFSFLVRIMHLPRMIKLKYFKGKGKQNYT